MKDKSKTIRDGKGATELSDAEKEEISETVNSLIEGENGILIAVRKNSIDTGTKLSGQIRVKNLSKQEILSVFVGSTKMSKLEIIEGLLELENES